jgi:iron(III)-salmochelin esterase
VTSRLARRAVLGTVAAFAIDCTKTEPRAKGGGAPTASAPVLAVSTPQPPKIPVAGGESFAEKELVFESSPVGPEKAVAIVPGWGAPGQRFPVLVALHGRGESVRGLDVGAHGWLRDYELGRAIARLRSPPLTRDDLKGFVDEDRLARINASLAERPFRGLIVVCPWVPDLFTDRDRTNLDAALPYGRFVTEQLLPRVLAETPALHEREATGIDGVSLGGRVALVVGLAHADRFGALGTLQAAIQESEPAALARRARDAITDAQKLRLRLVTSDHDYFRGAIGQLHLALQSAGVEHEHLVIPGPHDYAFNRGPGGVEMLLWHDRVLRGEASL